MLHCAGRVRAPRAGGGPYQFLVLLAALDELLDLGLVLVHLPRQASCSRHEVRGELPHGCTCPLTDTGRNSHSGSQQNKVFERRTSQQHRESFRYGREYFK